MFAKSILKTILYVIFAVLCSLYLSSCRKFFFGKNEYEQLENMTTEQIVEKLAREHRQKLKNQFDTGSESELQSKYDKTVDELIEIIPELLDLTDKQTLNDIQKKDIKELKDKIVDLALRLSSHVETASRTNTPLYLPRNQNKRKVLTKYNQLIRALNGPIPVNKTKQEVREDNINLIKKYNSEDSDLNIIPNPNLMTKEFLKTIKPFINYKKVWESYRIINKYRIAEKNKKLILADNDYEQISNNGEMPPQPDIDKFDEESLYKNTKAVYKYLKEIHGRRFYLSDREIPNRYEPQIFASGYPDEIHICGFEYLAENEGTGINQESESTKWIEYGDQNQAFQISTRAKNDIISTAIFLLEKTFPDEISSALENIRTARNEEFEIENFEKPFSKEIKEEIQKQIEQTVRNQNENQSCPVIYKLLLDIASQKFDESQYAEIPKIVDNGSMEEQFGISFKSEDDILEALELLYQNS